MRWQESAKSRSHQMREGESIGRWYRAIPPHRMWIGWDALQFGGQRLATDAEPRARLRRLDPAVAQLDWPAFGAQRCYFSDDAIFSRPALAQPSSTKPLGAPPTPMLPITSSPDLINTAPGSNRMPGTLVSAAAAGLAESCATSSLCKSFLKIGPSVTIVYALPRLESSVCGVARSCLSTARARPLRSSTVTLTLWPSLSQLAKASAAACDAIKALSSLGAADWACANDAQKGSATRGARRRKVMWIPRWWWGTGHSAAVKDSPWRRTNKARPAPPAAN